MEINFDLRWFHGSDRSEELTDELFRLLQSIHDTGSLRSATKECNVSYRHAWGLLQKWEQRIRYPLVQLERGKGAQLTSLGLKLLWEHKLISARLEPELASLASELTADLAELIDAPSEALLQVCGSHGLAVAMLRELANKGRLLLLDLQFHGSLDSLRMLQSRRCDMAGFHLPEGKLGSRLLPRFRRFLNPKTDAVIYAVRRRQGIMTLFDNPHAIQNLSDLTQNSIRFINRQLNSGTRATFDLLLEEHHIDPKKISGYYNEEFTHVAVAALVASGAADCGFGIEAAARQFNLHFIPYNWESYWFAVPKEKLQTPALSAFIALLRSAEFNNRVAALTGYESTRAGEVVMLDAELTSLLF